MFEQMFPIFIIGFWLVRFVFPSVCPSSFHCPTIREAENRSLQLIKQKMTS